MVFSVSLETEEAGGRRGGEDGGLAENLSTSSGLTALCVAYGYKVHRRRRNEPKSEIHSNYWCILMDISSRISSLTQYYRFFKVKNNTSFVKGLVKLKTIIAGKESLKRTLRFLYPEPFTVGLRIEGQQLTTVTKGLSVTFLQTL